MTTDHLSDAEILANADRLFPDWREDIQERFVLQNARAALALRAPAASVALIPVDPAMLLRLLQALNGPGHWMREMQATRNIDGLSGVPNNPINVLCKQYEAWAKSRAALPEQAKDGT